MRIPVLTARLVAGMLSACGDGGSSTSREQLEFRRDRQSDLDEHGNIDGEPAPNGCFRKGSLTASDRECEFADAGSWSG